MSGGAQSDPMNTKMVQAAAASWILRQRDGAGWSAEDQKAFDSWLEESLAHRIAFLRLHAVWQDADRLRVLRKPPGAFRSGVRRAVPKAVHFAAFLAIVAAVGVGSSWYLSRPNERSYATIVGERKIVRLTDGSRIELNTDTSLRLSIGATGRHVALLRGEAYFDIAHDAKRPMVVDVGNYRITDIGTQFSVRRSDQRLEVELVEGSARLESSAQGERSAVLKPGDVVIATADSLSLRKSPASAMTDSLSWRRGVLVFHHTPLSDVVAEFNRYNTQKMVLSDPALAERTITATLPTNDLNAFTRIAQEFFGLHVAKNNGGILISRSN
jgi:transmembrane sensor